MSTESATTSDPMHATHRFQPGYASIPKLSAKVVRWEMEEDGHVEYVVEVTRDESGVLPRVSWQVQQRWSKFEALGRDFYAEMYPVSLRTGSQIPSCKHESYLGKGLSSVLGKVTSYWDESSSEFREKRREDLETFLQRCLEFPEGEQSVCLLKFLQVVPEELDSLRRLVATANLERDEAKSMVSHVLEDRQAKLEAKLTAVQAQQRVETAALSQQKSSEDEQRKQLEEHKLMLAELQQELARTREAITASANVPITPQDSGTAVLVAPVPAPAPAPAPVPVEARQETSHKQAWRQLVAMGFNSVLASTVLSKVDGDVEAAMNELLALA
jgi:hypothetical protein